MGAGAWSGAAVQTAVAGAGRASAAGRRLACKAANSGVRCAGAVLSTLQQALLACLSLWLERRGSVPPLASGSSAPTGSDDKGSGAAPARSDTAASEPPQQQDSWRQLALALAAEKQQLLRQQEAALERLLQEYCECPITNVRGLSCCCCLQCLRQAAWPIAVF